MRKLTKRALAALLVVCALFGLVAMPAAALAEPSAENPKTYTYDFTILSNLAATEDTADADAIKVRWYNSELYYGFGYLNQLNLTPGQKTVLDGFYDNGECSYPVGEETATTKIDLNWRVLTAKNVPGETFEYKYTLDGEEKTYTATYEENYVRVGGRRYNKISTAEKYDGLWYEHRDFVVTDDGAGNVSASEEYATNGWIAIKIKAPEVGNYKVTLTPEVHNAGAQQASVYVLPGVVEDKAAIEAAIANGTGKLANTVSFYDKDTSDHTATAAVELGEYTISEPVDECTVIITADLNRAGLTDAQQARIHMDNIVFTQQAETPVGEGAEAKSYGFDFSGTGNGFTTDTKALTNTGTADAQTGGYDISKSAVSSMTWSNTTSVTLTATQLSAGWGQLRNANSAKTVYFVKDLSSTTATVDSIDEGITNYNMKRLMDAKYDSWGWKLLGSSVNTTNYFQINKDLSALNISSEDHFLAVQLLAPGSGAFEVDLGVVNAKSSSSVKTCHMGLNVYIVEKSDANGIADSDLYVSDVLPQTPDAYYNPNYDATATSTSADSNVVAGLLNYETDEPFVYNFEAGKEYVMYLQARVKDKEGNEVTYFSNTTIGDTAFKSEKKIRLVSIDCKPVEKFAASIGENTYSTLTAALAAAAEAGETVKLQSDVLLSEVVIDPGVTLDLNGHTLTTAAVGPTGKLVGEGVVKTYAGINTFVAANADMFAENTLPLYDAKAQGYKFYEYTLGNGVAKANEAADAVKFWYQFQFTGDKAAEAYALVASGTSGLTMGVNVNANGNSWFCSFENKKDAVPAIKNDPAAWAAAYAGYAVGASNPWLWINVTSASLADSLSVAPVIRVGGAEIVGANIQ